MDIHRYTSNEVENKQELWYNLFKGNLGEVAIKNMNDIFFDKNFNRKILKKWVSSQTSMLTENNGVTYIEKIENQVNDSGQSSIVPYGSDELEIYENILTPLKVEHVHVVASKRKQGESKFVLEYIDGLTCSDAPQAIHLYKAALKIGDLYRTSRNNISCVNETTFQKYYLSKEKTLNHLYEISKAFDISGLVSFTSDSYEKYSKYPIFLNHYDMHFKNMIYSKGDIRIIDWATAQFSPFYSDLYVLLRQAEQVDADISVIIDNYKNSAGLAELTEEEMLVGRIFWCIPAIHWLLELQGTDNVPFYEWAEDEYTSLLTAFRRYKEISA